MWETGGVKTLSNMFQDVTRGEAEIAAAGGRWERFKERFSEWETSASKGLAVSGRPDVGGNEAERRSAHGARGAGVVKLFALFRDKACGRHCRPFAFT